MRDSHLPIISIAIPRQSKKPSKDEVRATELETPASSVLWSGQSGSAVDIVATRSQDRIERERTDGLAANESYILHGKKLVVVLAAMLLSFLCISLDQTILATALPQIGSDLDAFNLQAWISGSFILTQTASLLIISQGLRIFSAKYVLLACVTVFEIGSVICGAARNVNTLITGRAISGVGAAGVFISVLQVASQITLLKDRARLMGWFGAVAASSAATGPLIGGALNDKVSWRWCFYLNLPLGGVALVTILLLVPPAPPLGADLAKRDAKSLFRQAVQMDWIGALLVLGAVTCLVLALQWGGNTKAWSSPQVIVTLVVAGITTCVFVVWDIRGGEAALVPAAIFKSRSVPAIVAFAFAVRISHLVLSYWLPVYYQAGRHSGATLSGIKVLPFMISLITALTGSFQVIGKTGRYWPFLVAGAVLLSIGSGLLYTINEFSSEAKIVCYQILCGVGIGLSVQTCTLAMQAEFNATPALISQATGIVSFAQCLGGTVGLAIAESIFSSSLAATLLKYAPDTTPAQINVIKKSPTFIYTSFPRELVPEIVKGYIESLKFVFVTGLPVGALCFIFAFFIKDINLNKPSTLPKVEFNPKGELPEADVLEIKLGAKSEDLQREIEVISIHLETPQDTITGSE